MVAKRSGVGCGTRDQRQKRSVLRVQPLDLPFSGRWNKQLRR